MMWYVKEEKLVSFVKKVPTIILAFEETLSWESDDTLTPNSIQNTVKLMLPKPLINTYSVVQE